MIVIVGAGPTGLTLALELARRAVPIRVLDRAAGPSNLDRATVLHPLSLEMLDRAGIAEAFVHEGIPLKRVHHYNETEHIASLPLDLGASRFRYDLSISQAKVEQVLRDQLRDLGVEVEWGTEVTSLKQQDDHVEINGTERADWVVGCDGYHSTVRSHLDEPFEGEDYPGTWAVLEARIEGLPFGKDEVGIMAGRHCLWLAPIPVDRRRLIWLDDRLEGLPTKEHAYEILKEHFPDHQLELSELSDQGRFRTHRRGALKLHHGRVLLAGDAAHSMSPAGGQGMNVGIHDAVNLGWKLARVQQGRSSPQLLESYEPERRPGITSGSEMSHQAHQVLSLTGSASFRRDASWRAAAALPALQAWNLNGTMQLRMDFPNSPWTLGLPALPPQEGHAPWAGPAPGERVPDEGPLLLEEPTSLHRLMRHSEHTLVLLLGDTDRPAPAWFPPGHVLTSRQDPGLYVHRQLGVTRDTLLAIRPDGYLGLRAEDPTAESLRQYEALLI